MQRRQRADLYSGIASLQVELIFCVWSGFYVLQLIRRCIEWQNEYTIRIAQAFDALDGTLLVLIVRSRNAQTRFFDEWRIESEENLVDAGISFQVGDTKMILAFLEVYRSYAAPHRSDVGCMPYIINRCSRCHETVFLCLYLAELVVLGFLREIADRCQRLYP